jgi:hypothetical protein
MGKRERNLKKPIGGSEFVEMIKCATFTLWMRVFFSRSRKSEI